MYELSIAAAPGETNDVSIEYAPGTIVVRDEAGVTPGEGCALADATTATCTTPAAGGTFAVGRTVDRVVLGDGDDSVRIPPVEASGFDLGQGKVDAGNGNDTVAGALNATGGPGDDRLDVAAADGGPGDDRIVAKDADGGDGNDVLGPRRADSPVRLRGGAGDDIIDGGPAKGFFQGDMLDGGDGNDRISGGDGDDRLLPGPGADVIDGGDGSDHVSFEYAIAPVRADLAAPGPVDPTGEGDAMTAVESVDGGHGDDTLLGGNGDSLLVGGAGSDRLEGRGGRDVIVGGPGADMIDGGEGADDLNSGTAAVDPERLEASHHESDAAPDALAGAAGPDILRIGAGDRADGGPDSDLVVAEGRPAAASCGTGARDRFKGLRVPRDCDRVVLFFDESIPARPMLRGSILSIRVPGNFGGKVTLVVRVDGRVVARAPRPASALSPSGPCGCESPPATGARCTEQRPCGSMSSPLEAATSASVRRRCCRHRAEARRPHSRCPGRRQPGARPS